MAEINEPPTVLPVQPSKPLRRPGQRRQPPRRPDAEGDQERRKRGPGPDSGQVLDEYA
jgi:hypothetical protein